MTHDHTHENQCLMCGPEALSAEEMEDRVRGDIIKKGWSDMGIIVHDVDDIPHNYSVGLSEYGHPDLITIGLPNDLGHAVLQAPAEQIMEGKAYLPHSYSKDVLRDMDVAFLPVDEMLNDDYPMTMTVRLYGEHCTAMQIIWPDPNNRFPWHWDFVDEYRQYQPLLGTWKGD